jgi:hypothetical protein
VIDLSALQLVLLVLIGWLECQEREAIAYLIEENRLRRQLGGRRLRFTDADRRRLAALAHRVGRAAVTEYMEHYHRERNHQGLDNRLLVGMPASDRNGLLNFYERAA